MVLFPHSSAMQCSEECLKLLPLAQLHSSFFDDGDDHVDVDDEDEDDQSQDVDSDDGPLVW